jgi:hypothetical protein
MKHARSGNGKRSSAADYPIRARPDAVRPTSYVRPDETFHDSDALAGFALPELAVEHPTTLLTVHAAFTAQHIISELRYQFEFGLLARGDREMLAQLGKEIAAELEGEN